MNGVLLLCAGGLLVACGATGKSDPIVGPLCGAADIGAPGVPTDRSLLIDAESRTFRLYLPTQYDSSRTWPLVLSLHGADENAESQASSTGLEATAQVKGFIAVHPEARSGLWALDDDSDVRFLNVVLDTLGAELCVDSLRIYAAGMSQGGDLASLFGCRSRDRIAAIASVAVFNFRAACESPTPMPVIAFAGRKDPIYVAEEGLNVDIAPFNGPVEARPGPIVDEASAWADANGCEPEPTTSGIASGVEKVEYHCPPGAEVVYYLHDGGHTWPGNDQPPGLALLLGPGVPDLNASEIIWQFFETAGS